jgi:hypothetical protein
MAGTVAGAARLNKGVGQRGVGHIALGAGGAIAESWVPCPLHPTFVAAACSLPEEKATSPLLP